MVLEFLSKADASSAFKINNAGDLLNKIKEHPLFDKFEINRYARPALPPRWTTYRDSDSFNIFIFYYSGLEKQYVILTWQEFESQYPRLSYDNGLGSQKINQTLTIYTKDYIFYRREYDGAEWFEYVPTKQYILDNADVFNDKNIIHADTYYDRNNYCWNEGYDYDL